jgi:hypothetical protein
MVMRLPSFSDFSPEILGQDLRNCMSVIQQYAPDDAKVIEEWARLYFGGARNKRSSNNIPATLGSTGLIVRGVRPFTLTAFGQQVLNANSPTEAAEIFCKEIIEKQNGIKLIDAVRELVGRGVQVTKQSLKKELTRLGIGQLSTGTTDHTTLKNWMTVAGIFHGEKNKPQINDEVLKRLIGISGTEHDEFGGLSLAQQIFLELVRKQHEIDAGPFLISKLLDACLTSHSHLFSEDQFAREVRQPLVEGGWIIVNNLALGRQGGKSGRVSGTAKLLGIPLDRIVPDFSQVVPADLRKKIRTPLIQILKDLDSNSHVGGIALELLALRMILDLRLEPRNFRLRSRDTAYAEVDVTAEGSHLLFSRWVFQCKRIKTTAKVGVSDVAKEVGIAVYTKAHVIAMVATTDFTADAYEYAREITKATHLQFLFLPKKAVERYLKEGQGFLLHYVMENAGKVMAEKRTQPV